MFSNNVKLARHSVDECRKHRCIRCNRICKNRADLQKHQASPPIECGHCTHKFCDRNHHEQHLRSIRRATDETIPDLNQRVYPETKYEDEDGYQEQVQEKYVEITNREKITKYYTVINKQTFPDFTYRDLNNILLGIFSSRQNAFRINLGFGFILHNITTGEFRYHYVSSNNMLFDHAQIISTINDIHELMKHIVALDLATNYYLKKRSSGWVLAGLTNVEIKITAHRNVLIGSTPDLPEYITKRRCIYSLTHEREEKITDNNCFFRCLAVHTNIKKRCKEGPRTIARYPGEEVPTRS